MKFTEFQIYILETYYMALRAKYELEKTTTGAVKEAFSNAITTAVEEMLKFHKLTPELVEEYFFHRPKVDQDFRDFMKKYYEESSGQTI